MAASVHLAEQIQTPREVWLGKAALGKVLAQLGRDKEAEAQLTQATQTIEAIAANLQTPRLRHSFLNAMPVLKVYEALGHLTTVSYALTVWISTFSRWRDRSADCRRWPAWGTPRGETHYSEEHAMTSTLLSRRDMLKGTVALATAASVGINTTTRLRRAAAQERTALPRARIDGALRQAVEAKDVPGVVAMAATDKGLLYEGAFGTRVLDSGAAMTLDTVFRIASMTKAITSVAAMQLVEQGKLQLDEPVPNIDPALGSPQVLEGLTPPAHPGCVPPSGRSRCATC